MVRCNPRSSGSFCAALFGEGNFSQQYWLKTTIYTETIQNMTQVLPVVAVVGRRGGGVGGGCYCVCVCGRCVRSPGFRVFFCDLFAYPFLSRIGDANIITFGFLTDELAPLKPRAYVLADHIKLAFHRTSSKTWLKATMILCWLFRI